MANVGVAAHFSVPTSNRERDDALEAPRSGASPPHPNSQSHVVSSNLKESQSQQIDNVRQSPLKDNNIANLSTEKSKQNDSRQDKKVAKQKASKEKSKKKSKGDLKKTPEKTSNVVDSDKLTEIAPNHENLTSQTKAPTKTRNLVEELKLFQNNQHLLNQQDPLQQLHIQLNALIKDDSPVRNLPLQSFTGQQATAIQKATGYEGLSTSEIIIKQQQESANNHHSSSGYGNAVDSVATYDSNENVFTVKKGVLWQQQNYDKFHQRLFSRWKKRYFILTTDYLVCFKKSSSKVGRSEMGKFLYKTALSDVTKIEWLKPSKSDKGAIILYLNKHFNLYLWAKENLDDWMFMIKESIERIKNRRSFLMKNDKKKIANKLPILDQSDNGDIYENTIPAIQDVKKDLVLNNRDNKTEDQRLNINIMPREDLKNNSLTFTKHPSRDESNSTVDVLNKFRSPRKTETKEEELDVKPQNKFGDDNEALSSLQLGSSSGSEKVKLIEHENAKDDPNERVDQREQSISKVVEGGTSREPMMIYDSSNNDSIANDRLLNGNSQGQSSNMHGLITSNSSRSSHKSGESRLEQSQAISNDLSTNLERPVVDGTKKDQIETDLVTGSKRSDKRDCNTANLAINESNINQDTCNSNHKLSNERNRSAHGFERSPADNKNVQSNSGNESSKAIQRPSTNLIRRDDSWQSLASLTRVGKIAPSSMQAPRSMMSDNKQHISSIESSITPSRAGPFIRHQSIQPLSSQRKLRPLPPIGQHAASFDEVLNNQQSTSYQQKLLQLQLLHNSNYVDYVRSNGETPNDYQIYGPDSASNHYGYSSMRSNLKSATSEFSFIRPSSSSHMQSTLPHQNHPVFLDNQSTPQQPIRSSLILPNKTSDIHQSDSNNNDISCLPPATKQFLVNPATGERIINLHSLNSTRELPSSEFAPPMRELPLIPNKKRTLNNLSNINGKNLPKSSSLTSSIACFFRRAFSRRSRKGSKKCPKLAESCSSSLGAFEDGYANVPIVPSAFSTGSKSVDGSRKAQREQKLMQSQRMVDMIEAFTNKTLLTDLDHAQITPIQDSARQYPVPNGDFNVTPKAAPRLPNHLRTMNQFGSPLHKSNSISATTGLSLADINNRRAFLYDNELAIANGGSPMLMRSTKVMSANLTPLLTQREPSDTSQHQFFLSPRNSRHESHLSRPSSIYGQPSMISSPMISRDDRNNFGAHRNSLHNHHFRDKTNPSTDSRRQQVMRIPFLDTTREVAEELSSPVMETNRIHEYDHSNHIRSHHVEQSPLSRCLIRGENIDMISASPSSDKLRYNRAIVNPILQSPTMDTIYDNHPMLNKQEFSSYQLYDNHNQLITNHHQQSPSLNRTKVSNSMTQFSPSFIANTEDHYSQRVNRLAQSTTPSHQEMGDRNRKPSAIVTPSTPNHGLNNLRNDINPSNLDQFNSRGHPQSQYSRSPMMTRRLPNQPIYQQSPLVSMETRVLTKGDGTQATVIGDRESGYKIGQPVINIAGAPGINLEPSLAAALLRGTNIDAYESSTFDRLTSEPSTASSKTFLVSSRLSKSMAHSQSSSNDNGSTSSILRDDSATTASNNTTYLRSSKDELSSSGSRSMNSSLGQGSLRAKVPNSNDSREDPQDEPLESSSSDTHKNKGAKEQEITKLHRKTSSKRLRRKRSELQDDLAGNVEDIDKHEERNWITSKLVD